MALWACIENSNSLFRSKWVHFAVLSAMPKRRKWIHLYSLFFVIPLLTICLRAFVGLSTVMLSYLFFVRSFAVSFILLLSRVVYGTSASVLGAYNLINLSVIRSFACSFIRYMRHHLVHCIHIKVIALVFVSLQLQNTDSITYQLDLSRETSENPLNKSYQIPICMAFLFCTSWFDIKIF